jgi:ketosteroid isomerase-like protein
MSEENVEIVKASLDGWNRGDFDAWMDSSHSHPEIEWSSEVTMRMEGSETVFRGFDGLRDYWDEWHSLWDVRIDPTEIRDLGDTILVIAQTRTRVEGSGIDIEGVVAYVFEFEGALARRVRSYLDPRRALEAVGLSE